MTSIQWNDFAPAIGINFPPRQIGPFISECLVTGLYRDNGQVVLAVPDFEVQNGARLG